MVAVHELSKRLMREHKIILIEKRKTHLYQPALLWSALGLQKISDAQMPYDSFAKKRIKVVNAEVLKIDPENKRVETSHGGIDFDSALIALGAEFNHDKIPGLKEFGHSFYTPEGSDKVRDAVSSFNGKNIALVIPGLPFKCPAAPYEMAFLLDEYLKRKKIRDNIVISFFTPELQPMPAAGLQVGKFISKSLEKKNIRYHPNHILREVSMNELIFDVGTYGYDLLIYVPPHQAPKVIRESKLAGERGWIPVDSKTLRTNFPHIRDRRLHRDSDRGRKISAQGGVIAHGQPRLRRIILFGNAKCSRQGIISRIRILFVEMGGAMPLIFPAFYHQPAPRVRLLNANPVSY